MCTNLSRLTLDGNPLCSPANYQPPMTYRSSVLESISQLDYLDDTPCHIHPDNPGSQSPASGDTRPPTADDIAIKSTLELEEHWNFINSMLVESGLLAESVSRGNREQSLCLSLSPGDSGRPASSLLTGGSTSITTGTSSSTRPSSAMRPMSAQRRALTTALGRPLTTQTRPASATSVDSADAVEDKADDSSLTAGQVVCGSVTRSLRRGHGSDMCGSQSARPTNRRVTPMDHRIPVTEDNGDDDDDGDNVEESCERVLTELSQWRRDYER